MGDSIPPKPDLRGSASPREREDARVVALSRVRRSARSERSDSESPGPLRVVPEVGRDPDPTSTGAARARPARAAAGVLVAEREAGLGPHLGVVRRGPVARLAPDIGDDPAPP